MRENRLATEVFIIVQSIITYVFYKSLHSAGCLKKQKFFTKKYLEIFLLFAQVSSLLRACLRADEQITLRNKLELDISSNEEDIGANYWKECK